jgi:DnaJ-class molecular chaperone
MSDPYADLGLAKGASEDEIKKAYRKAAMKNHPDKGGDPEKFKKIQSAYDILSDPEKKQNFDRFGTATPQQPQGFPGGFPFPQGFGFPQGFQQVKRNNIEHKVKITLEDSYRGIMKRLKIPIKKVCQKCRVNCQMCGGSGTIHIMIITQMCPACHGCGGQQRGCGDCGSQGHTTDIAVVTFEIPAGIESGQQMIAQGLGEQPIGIHDIAGDFVLLINIIDDPHFMRQGLDLIYPIKITFEESVGGKVITIPHFDGEIIVNTQEWGVLDPREDYIIKNKGFKGIGNLRVSFNIVYPPKDKRFTLTS